MRPILGQDERNALLNPKDEFPEEGITFRQLDKDMKGRLSEKATFIVDEALDDIINSYVVDEGIILYNKDEEVIATIKCDYDFFKEFRKCFKGE